MIRFDSYLIEIVIRTAVVYFAILVGLRLAGKREIGQMTTFDLVVILLIANAVQNAMVGEDNSLVGGLVAAGVLLVINSGVSLARRRFPFFKRAVEGEPTILVNDGKFIKVNLAREGIEEEDVLMSMREHGITSLDEVRLAIMEIDGSISIVPVDSKTIRTRRHFRFLKGSG